MSANAATASQARGLLGSADPDQKVARIELEACEPAAAQRHGRDSGKGERRAGDLPQPDGATAEEPFQKQNQDVGCCVDQRAIGRRRIVQPHIDGAAADEHAEKAEDRDEPALRQERGRVAGRPRAAKGSTMRNAPPHRRKASVHGPTSSITERPKTILAAKNSGTSATNTKSPARMALESIS